MWLWVAGKVSKWNVAGRQITHHLIATAHDYPEHPRPKPPRHHATRTQPRYRVAWAPPKTTQHAGGDCMLWALPTTAHGLGAASCAARAASCAARRGEGRAGSLSGQKRRGHKQNFLQHNTVKHHLTLASRPTTCNITGMSFQSLPITAREVKATEAVLQKLYNAAKLGLRGDNLALNAGLLPIEYRRLCQMDPIAELAVQKGYADAEGEMSHVVYTAARNGDSKAAMDMLKHRHDWVAKQQVQIDVSQQISVISALEAAERRVIDATVENGILSETPSRANGLEPLTDQRKGHADGFQHSDTSAVERAVPVRP